MRIEIRLNGKLYTEILQDLARPHPFAAERVLSLDVPTYAGGYGVHGQFMHQQIEHQQQQQQ